MPVKNVAQQGVLALHTVRALLVKQQTMLANALRSLAAVPGRDCIGAKISLPWCGGCDPSTG